MKATVKNLKNCKKLLEIKVPPEKVKDTFDKVYGELGKVSSVPGYRVGKAPRDLLVLHYSKSAQEEVIKKLIPETYREVLEEYKLNPIGYPDISDVHLDLKEGVSYKASIEISPEFPLKNYKGLKLKKKDCEVKEEDVLKNLENLRKVYGEQVPKKDGEEKEKIFPAIDDEFAKDLGYEDLVKLKDAVRKGLKERMEEDCKVDLEMQVINQLVDGVDFEIPESLVNAEKERLIKDANIRIAYMEAIGKKQNPDKEFKLSEKDKKELEENAQKQAVRQVKAFFILDRIAVTEKIYLKEEELDEHIDKLASSYKKTKEEIKALLEKENRLNEMAVNLRNQKVMEFLLKEARYVYISSNSRRTVG